MGGVVWSARPLAIAGRVGVTTQLALRRVLRAKERDQALIVLDYQGLAAGQLEQNNSGHLHKSPLLWCDLANKRKPVAILRMRQTGGLPAAFKVFLARCSSLGERPLAGETLNWAAKLVWQLADQGTVGLAAFLRGLHRPEVLQWFRREHKLSDEIDRLSDLIKWMLDFSGVWAASEGNNLLDLRQAIAAHSTIWLEMPAQHFEKIEHGVVSSMAEAAVLDALIPHIQGGGSGAVAAKPPLVLYVLPLLHPLSFCAEAARAKHVGVFQFSTAHPLAKSAQAWMEAKADFWVAGEVGQIAMPSEPCWLNKTEAARLRELRNDQLWARSGLDGKAVTMSIAPSQSPKSMAVHHRHHVLKKRHFTPIRQFAAAARDVTSQAEANGGMRMDLYRQICRKEVLYWGWLRVRNHDKKSHGSDEVTIGQFGLRVEQELERLAEELEAGRYRCQPLRTVKLRKPDGGVRVLKLSCVRDQVVQAACLALIEPLFDPRFSRYSFAYRPGRSAHHALACARDMIRAGKTWAVTADITKCFDNIDHDVLMRLMGDVIEDKYLLGLIRHWLSVDAIDFDGFAPTELGVPQGAALSPLLANIYLDLLDQEFERVGIAFVRYADDYLVLCNDEHEAKMALSLMTDFLHSVLRLSLKPAKTQYCPLQKGAGFLGFLLEGPQISIQQEKLDRVLAAIGEDLKTLALPRATFSARSFALQHMNAMVRGFRNYFLVEAAPLVVRQLRSLDSEIDALAMARLPVALRHDMAWLARERMVPVDHAEGAGDQAAEAMANAIGVYADYVHGAVQDVAVVPQGTPLIGQQERSGTADTAKAELKAQVDEVEGSEKDSLLIDGRLYVMNAGGFVTAQGEDLVVRRRREALYRVPLCDLRLVVLQGPGVGISVDLAVKLGERDVPVVFVPLVGRPAAVAQPLQGGRSRLKQQQILRKNDPDILAAGISMLAAKIGNQASILKETLNKSRAAQS